MAKYYVYVLRSRADCQFYVGLTNDLPARVQAHNSGRVSSTKARIPFELVYWEGSLNVHDAARREKYLKTAWASATSRGVEANPRRDSENPGMDGVDLRNL